MSSTTTFTSEQEQQLLALLDAKGYRGKNTLMHTHHPLTHLRARQNGAASDLPVRQECYEPAIADRIEGGTLEVALQTASDFILQDIVGIDDTAALVFPASQSPVAALLSTHTACHPLYLLDPDEENLSRLREQVEENRAVYGKVERIVELPEEIQALGIVINPFGLQHYTEEVPHYASTVRARCQSGAVLITIDWGYMRYPEDLAQMPGIEREIRFNHQALLPAYGPETGWVLSKQREISYEERHTIEEVAAQLEPAEAGQLLQALAQRRDRSFVIDAAIIYRLYRTY